MMEVCVPTNNICLDGSFVGQGQGFHGLKQHQPMGVGHSLTLYPNAHVGCFVKIEVLLFSYLFKFKMVIA